MRHLFPIFFLLLLLQACTPTTSTQLEATTSKNTLSKTKKGDPMLLGHCDKDALLQVPFNKWFEKRYETYHLAKSDAKELKTLSKGVEAKLFVGTWCGDSKRHLPGYFHIADEIGFSDQMKLIALNQKKQSPDLYEKGLNIHRVPTLVLYKEGKEIGRIVEHPVETLEKDLLKILNNENYKHNYQLVTKVNDLIAAKGSDYVLKNADQIAKELRPVAQKDKELNTYGYVIAARGKKQEALAAFRLNTLLFPKIANTYDSLGELYLELGEEELAITNYKKVLELKPNDENATKILGKILLE